MVDAPETQQPAEVPAGAPVEGAPVPASGGKVLARKVLAKTKVLAERGRVAAREAWIDFRQNSLYFQVKAGLVAAYVVIVLATVMLAPPSPPTFKVTAGSVPWGVGKRTYVDLDNLEEGTMKDIMVEVHGRVVDFDGKESRGPWRMKVARLAEGDTLRLWPEKLLSADNRPAGDNLDVKRVRIFEVDDPEDVLVDMVPVRKDD